MAINQPEDFLAEALSQYDQLPNMLITWENVDIPPVWPLLVRQDQGEYQPNWLNMYDPETVKHVKILIDAEESAKSDSAQPEDPKQSPKLFVSWKNIDEPPLWPMLIRHPDDQLTPCWLNMYDPETVRHVKRLIVAKKTGTTANVRVMPQPNNRYLLRHAQTQITEMPTV